MTHPPSLARSRTEEESEWRVGEVKHEWWDGVVWAGTVWGYRYMYLQYGKVWL